MSQRFSWLAQPITAYMETYWGTVERDKTVVFWSRRDHSTPMLLGFMLSEYLDKVFDKFLNISHKRLTGTLLPTVLMRRRQYTIYQIYQIFNIPDIYKRQNRDTRLRLVVWIRCNEHPSHWESLKKGG